MTKETSPEIASLAARVLSEQPRQGDEHLSFNALLVTAKKLAGSALAQREDDDASMENQASDVWIELGRRFFVAGYEAGRNPHVAPGIPPVTTADQAWDRYDPPEDLKAELHDLDEKLLDRDLGIQVDALDVLNTWGAREAKDTAMLLNLVCAAAIEQLVPFVDEVRDDMWPAQVTIRAADLERLARQQRIVRLEPEPNTWAIRLLAPNEDNMEENPPANPEWGKLGWLRRHIQAFTDYHSLNETAADGFDMAASSEYHGERREIGRSLLVTLDFHQPRVDADIPGDDSVKEEPDDG